MNFLTLRRLGSGADLPIVNVDSQTHVKPSLFSGSLTSCLNRVLFLRMLKETRGFRMVICDWISIVLAPGGKVAPPFV